jgi:adenylosuccinate synthase
MIVDADLVVEGALQSRKQILLEGQLGAMRDLDWGTYPYVTSSTTIAGGGGVGGGVPPRAIEHVVGVVKAYTSAVGTGPVPAELTGPEGERLRQRGHEFGTTTGRPRRVGWLDTVAVRYAHRLNAFTGLALTKLDILDGFDPIKVVTAYRIDGREVASVPATVAMESARPVYEELPGWKAPTAGARSWDELPSEARQYVSRIEEIVCAPISIVSVGPAREQTILR